LHWNAILLKGCGASKRLYETIFLPARFIPNLPQIAINHHSFTLYDMKFSVSSSELLKQLQIANGAIGSNPVLPILEDYLFKIEILEYLFIILTKYCNQNKM
jgi:hypothetical protein